MHDDYEMAMMPPTIVLTSDELPDVRNWEVGSKYDITKIYKGAKQIEKTEYEDGRVVVILQTKPEEPKIEGELVKK